MSLGAKVCKHVRSRGAARRRQWRPHAAGVQQPGAGSSGTRAWRQAGQTEQGHAGSAALGPPTGPLSQLLAHTGRRGLTIIGSISTNCLSRSVEEFCGKP